jgi:putative ABC transport system substrate-binding protein
LRPPIAGLEARVPKGEKPDDIPVEGVEITQLFVNPGAAAKMGVVIPDTVLKRARTVVQ